MKIILLEGREAGFLESHSSAYSVGGKSSLLICQ